MKKALSFVLSLIFILTVASVPVSAEEITEVYFNRCETRDGWSKHAPNNLNIRVDSEDCTEGVSSVKFINDAKGDGILSVSCKLRQPVDIGKNNILAFDIYVDDPEVFKAGNGQIELSSSGGADNSEINWGINAIYSGLKKGWNSVQLSLSRAGYYDGTTGRFDKTAVNFFRMYQLNPVTESHEYVLKLDNMRFTSKNSVPAPDVKGEYTLPEGISVSDEDLMLGNVDETDGIGASDALVVLQYSVGKVYLKNNELLRADLDASGSITANDALLLLQYTVGKITGFPANETVKANESYMSQIDIKGSRRITPYFENDKTIIADADVVYFGAAGDGVTDDTLAFERALGYVDSLGGGTVFVPVGKYVITKTLYIPDGVTLRGDAPTHHEAGKTEGTVLLAFVGRNDPDGEPFIHINQASGVKNLSIYYPEQDSENIVPYSWTIKEGGQHGPTIEDVILVNSYKGIQFGPAANALQRVRNIGMTALKTGYFIDYNVDICVVENLYISPGYWCESTLDKNVNVNAVKQYMKQNTTALDVQHVDWTYFTDIDISGCNIAMHLRRTTEEGTRRGAPNGQIFNFNFTDCITGIYAEYVNEIGHMYTNGRITAQKPLVIGEKCVNNNTFNNVVFENTGSECVKIAAGDVTFTDCTFNNVSYGSADGVKISPDVDAALTNCKFTGFDTDVIPDRNSRLALINCNTEETLTVGGVQKLIKKIWDENCTTKTVESDAYDYERRVRTKALGSAFIDITKEPYGVTPGGTKDISSSLQRAIDDAYNSGGGVVYLPSGTYRVENPITVKYGVEVIGSSSNMHHSVCQSTVIYTDFGKGVMPQGKALFTLESQSGISGFKIMYDKLTCPAGGKPSDTYSYTVRGDGYNVRIVNITFINATYGVDLFTNRCDGHYVEALAGTVLANGIKTGGGSANGIVRDILFNVHYTGGGQYSNGADVGGVWDYNRDNVQSIVIGKTVNEIYYNNFMLGALSGLVIEEGPENAFILAHGSDGATYSMTARGNNPYPVTLVNSQFVCVGGKRQMHYVDIEDNFSGNLVFIQTNFWGTPNNAAVLRGDIEFYSGTLLRCGKNGMQLKSGSLKMVGIISWQPDTVYDVVVDEAADGAFINGNIYESGGKFKAPDNKLSGSDTVSFDRDGLPSVVNFHKCDNIIGWSRYGANGNVLENDTETKTNGYASVSAEFDLTSDSFIMMCAKLATPVDMGENDILEFDLYLEDASAIKDKGALMELTSSGECDVAEVCWYLDRAAVDGLKDGWNHIVFKIQGGIFSSTDETKTFDKHSVNYFRMFVTAEKRNITDYCIKIDNMRFTCTLGNK